MVTVVVGIGNADRGDDGVGPEVIARLRERDVGDAKLAVTDPTRLIECIGGADLAILVDACHGIGEPGAVRTYSDIPPEATTASSHGLSAATAVRLAGLVGAGPKRVRYVVVEGSDFGVGAPMSPPVKASLDRVVDEVLKELSLTAKRLRVYVQGAVQGVGFRPFVYRLATELGLTGFCLNSVQGAFIEVEGSGAGLDLFLERLRAELPPPGFIARLESAVLDPVGFTSFEIRESNGEGSPSAAILPDIAVCPDCLREMNDPADRRYRYPFINCTHCGPRYSILGALPYDRANTSMSGFRMCEECRAEYENPADRRFHAEPIACPVCGPRIELWDVNGWPTAELEAALAEAAKIVRKGGILAVKGIGGFHLLTDARKEAAVTRLRERKGRFAKPFAVMVPTLQSARTVAKLSREQEAFLRSPEAPILLAEAIPGKLAPAIAPGLSLVGLMLPYSPLHHLLMRKIGFPVVATSGNLSDEPICCDEHEAVRRFAGIADAFLVHNRPILRPIDDSVVRFMDGRPVVLRRGRGFAPVPHPSADAEPGWLGVGAHIKGSVAISVPGLILAGQYVGDLQNTATRRRLEAEVKDLLGLYSIKPAKVAHDLHPDYASTRFAEATGLPMTGIQHHLAHAAACVADNDLHEPVFAIVWDGTGYGVDGTIWGGEFFRISARGLSNRSSSLRPFLLAGGESAVREGRRAALGLLIEHFGSEWPPEAEAWMHSAFTDCPIAGSGIRNLLARGRGTVCTSMGRLFDALASIGADIHASRFEGDAAMRFEALASAFSLDLPDRSCGKDDGESAPAALIQAGPIRDKEGGPLRWDWGPIVEYVLRAREDGVGPAEIAYRVHLWLADLVLAAAKEAKIQAVVLSGGCFQNKLLYELSARKLREAGFRPYGHQRIPPNDEGIAFGQVVAASRHWRLEPCA